jgi:hypothetical protein
MTTIPRCRFRLPAGSPVTTATIMLHWPRSKVIRTLYQYGFQSNETGSCQPFLISLFRLPPLILYGCGVSGVVGKVRHSMDCVLGSLPILLYLDIVLACSNDLFL